MALPRYLAQTSEEFHGCASLPRHLAWMACHFSPYGRGLVNLPPALPRDAMVILNDRIPMTHHDPELILQQLRQLAPAYLLLDFQQQATTRPMELTRLLVTALPCPVGVPAAYGKELDCPLFLPLPPPDAPLDVHLRSWQGREIWLELALNAMTYTVTEQGAAPGDLTLIPSEGQTDSDLCCHYQLSLTDEKAEFALWRTREDLDSLLDQAGAFGVTKAVGLWQELR